MPSDLAAALVRAGVEEAAAEAFVEAAAGLEDLELMLGPIVEALQGGIPPDVVAAMLQEADTQVRPWEAQVRRAIQT